MTRSHQQTYSQNGVAFIVDEVQTGGGFSGEMWAHSLWNLQTPPGLLCFTSSAALT